MSDVDHVLAQALRLPARARAAVVAELIQSLEETDVPEQSPEDVEAAWAEEIKTRLAEVDTGVVTTVPWSDARRRIFAAAAGPRETP